MTLQGYGSDRAMTEQGAQIIPSPQSAGVVSISPDSFTTLGRADRRCRVERLHLAGHNAAEIADKLGIHPATVKKDIEYVEYVASQRADTERLRQHVTRAMLDVADVAHERYVNEGSTVEGRLVIDAYARASKVNSLDEPQGSAEVNGELAALLAAMRARIE
jgi:DNA-binding transcriptional regulator YdaS (Cro superfamily)